MKKTHIFWGSAVLHTVQYFAPPTIIFQTCGTVIFWYIEVDRQQKKILYYIKIKSVKKTELLSEKPSTTN